MREYGRERESTTMKDRKDPAEHTVAEVEHIANCGNHAVKHSVNVE